MAAPSISVIGSYNYDLVTRVPVVPNGGETVAASGFSTHYGGKGANTALALRRLGGKDIKDVFMIGCVGDDQFGKELVGNMKSEGVEVSMTQVLNNQRTGSATILVEDSGENRIMVFPGANHALKDSDIEPEMWNSSKFVVMQNEIASETTFSILRQVADNSDSRVKSVFNPSPLPKIPMSEWPHIDIIVVNETEAEALTNVSVSSTEGAFKALPVLLKKCDLAIITLGGAGVTWMEAAGSPSHLPAMNCGKVVDTTGAGDSFLAAFLTKAANSENKLSDCIKFATKVSGIVVTREGASSSIPKLEELE